MAKFIGRLVDVGLAKETVRGTAVDAAFWIPKLGLSIDDKFEFTFNESALGRIEDTDGGQTTKTWAEGDLEGKIKDQSFGLILLGAMGSVNTVVNPDASGLVYDHTFSLAQDAQHQSLTISLSDPVQDYQFANSMITALEITSEIGDFVKYTAGFMGQQGVAVTKPATYIVENEFRTQDVTVKFAADKASLPAATAINVRSLNMTIEKNVESDDTLGSITPIDFLNKQFSMSGEMEITYEATTYHDLALGGTSQAMQLDFLNADVTIGTAANPQLNIQFPEVKFTGWERTLDNDEIVVETIEWKAVYNVTENEMTDIVLTNLHDGTDY